MLESKIRADIEDQYQNAVTARSPEGAMLLESLSRESNETHELFQETESVGIARGSAAKLVLQEFNRAKEALCDIKCELRQPDTLDDKNRLLYAVRGAQINTHYIGKLSVDNRQVLSRQAIEANRGLEYVLNYPLAHQDESEEFYTAQPRHYGLEPQT